MTLKTHKELDMHMDDGIEHICNNLKQNLKCLRISLISLNTETPQNKTQTQHHKTFWGSFIRSEIQCV